MRLKRLIVPLVAAAVLAACSHGSSGTVTFGAAGPFSQAYGIANKHGIELAVEQINDSPAWSGGRKLQIAFVDDSGSGVQASAVASKFVDSTRIVAVVGHVNSGAMVSAAHVYDGHLAAVATTATSPALTGISPWAFRVITSDSTNGMTIAQYVNKLGRKRAAVLYENNPYGRGLVDSFRRNYSGQIISIDPIDEGADQSFEPFVSYYKREHADVVFVAGTDGSGVAFLKEARRQQLSADLVGGDGWQTVATDSAVKPLTEGIYVGAPFSAQDPRPEVKTFVTAYKAKYHELPDGNAALAYDATKLLAQAVEKVGPDRKKIRDYLAGLTEQSAYHGVTGTIRFRPDGDPVGKGIVMTRAHQGVLQVESGQ
ncbi:MAG TPA: ABC transporter substrate-binding protein [Gemmatimonadaceae bacterium]|nr:ABC transporter substrate-binding protein [Gemmatimonadaceae bacterium]